MTCIVGLISEDKVWMGGDSAGVSGLNITVRKDAKVFKNGNFLIGYTSSFRMGQLLRFKFNPPAYYAEQYNDDPYKYMCTDFIDAIRKCLKDGGYTRIESNEEKGGCFLIGFQNRLFCIDSDFQVGEAIADFDAVGCGEQYAKGSLYSTTELNVDYEMELTPEFIIEQALESAVNFSGGVRPPFIIESI
jgi:ATP-dependent protease HslVU (ClpYQ) peptidase subunit